jgi:lysozyme family protein
MNPMTYKTAIEFLLKWEVGFDRSGKLREDGGYTNDPQDAGGETKWGIAKRAHPDLDIPNLTLEQAFDVYKNDYWTVYSKRVPALDLDTCVPDYAVSVFDSGFNCGVNRVYKWHLTAIKEKDPTKVLLGLRDKHYFDLVSSDKAKYGKFYKGWLNRLNDLKKLVEVIRQDATTGV